jgi:hypothetical protein
MPETDSGSTGEADGTDYSWDVKLACRKDTDTAFSHELFDIPIAQAEAKVEPDAVADNLCREPMAFI